MENLLECRGRAFTATISGEKVNGHIQFEDGDVYLCQDVLDGAPCVDKLGHKHSWCVDDGSPKSLSSNSVVDFKLVEETSNDSNTVEITLQEVADKFEIPVELLRIKI